MMYAEKDSKATQKTVQYCKLWKKFTTITCTIHDMSKYDS